MTPAEAAKLVGALGSCYPASKIDRVASAMYERLIADLAFESTAAAIDRLVKSSRFMPTVAEIRAAEADVRCGPQRLGAEAWGDVTAAIRRVGASQPPPPFPDPLVGQCVALMGWRNLCLGSNDAADRARFIELYDGLQARQRVDLVVGKALPAASSARLPEAAESLGGLSGLVAKVSKALGPISGQAEEHPAAPPSRPAGRLLRSTPPEPPSATESPREASERAESLRRRTLSAEELDRVLAGGKASE